MPAATRPSINRPPAVKAGLVAPAAARFGRRLAAPVRALVHELPKGRPISDERWEGRHRGITLLMWLHVPALFAVGLLTGHTAWHSAADVAPIVASGLVARRTSLSRSVRSGATTLGLVVCSAALVHLSGGNVEMHFHFFVVVGVITMYQDWVPFGLALFFVVAHHGVLGVLSPRTVYNHEAAYRNPWLWAAVHGAFVLAASVAHVLAWRLNEDQALRDELTRLPNRALLTDRVRGALARRARDSREVTVLFVDLDGFKDVNDTLGHAAGDELLVEVAERIGTVVRHTDVAARLGGDEFAVLLDGHDRASALAVAERIRLVIAEPVLLTGANARVVTASIGAVVVSSESTVGEVLRNADLAMYMAKEAGRGRVQLFEDAMFEQATERAGLESDLQAAIANGDLTVHYQPCVELADGAIAGVEALVRWTHPERGVVAPDVFIPVAEASGMIHDLGEQVLRTACRDAARLRRALPGLTVAVNVSARQLASADFVGIVTSALRENGLAGSALVLEMTESILVNDVDLAVRRLNQLKALGVRLAIDDFGTGYSSLSYLRQFPIDILKIDRSFIEQLEGEGEMLARTIVRLGHSMRLEVIAEGVEQDGQRNALRRLGCARAQGFLFAPAAPVATVEELLAATRGTGDWWRTAVALPAPRTSEENASSDVAPTA